jgi:hypothetical protein
MRIIKVTIEGTRAILLNNPASMGTGASDGKKKIPTPTEEANQKCYWTPDKKSLAFPGVNIHRSMIHAAGAFKAGKLSMTPYIAGGIGIEPEMIPFYIVSPNNEAISITKYDIDTRRAVVQRQGVMRSRPRIKQGWNLQFEMQVSEDDLPQKSFEMLKAILAEAGRRIGIGDFRPQKTGPFGKFAVTGWEDVG